MSVNENNSFEDAKLYEECKALLKKWGLFETFEEDGFDSLECYKLITQVSDILISY